jgi:hypothetical protein
MPLQEGQRHNLADIESDLLMLYLTLNQDWASFKMHNPTDVLPKAIKGMKPRMKVQGSRWLNEEWIGKWINAERRRFGQPALRD